MAVFTGLELTGGWVQGLGRIHFKEFPSEGQSVEIARANTEEVRWYEVIEVEFTPDATSAGNIVLMPTPRPNGPYLSAELMGNHEQQDERPSLAFD
jgi:hypothetical protein